MAVFMWLLTRNRERETERERVNILCTWTEKMRLQASALYYKSKLQIHNFTIYDLQRNDGYCFLWNECEGGIQYKLKFSDTWQTFPRIMSNIYNSFEVPALYSSSPLKIKAERSYLANKFRSVILHCPKPSEGPALVDNEEKHFETSQPDDADYIKRVVLFVNTSYSEKVKCEEMQQKKRKKKRKRKRKNVDISSEIDIDLFCRNYPQLKITSYSEKLNR
ncbi:hypothetical protein ANN_19264 [Periplaneta americana]|uniref:Uncharacterized protein n=1 Tax=Periplaneta americana TaxID=6978 RepID=A0ABQ8S9R5_PERAM|nr:hypothetical protein ANN_19264 [Periplaneta americana]